jgi:hypothetical protein
MIEAAVRAMVTTGTPIDSFFHDWRGGAPRDGAAYADAAWAPLHMALADFTPVSGAKDHAYWTDQAPCSMHIDEVEAIWSAIDRDDDWTPLQAKVAAIRRMGDAMQGAGAPGK